MRLKPEHKAPRRGLGAQRGLLSGGVALAVLLGVPVAAQEGGLVWSLGVSQAIQTESNPGLNRPAADSETTARTNLSLGVSSVTPRERLSFTASGSLVAGDTDDDTFQNPDLQLGYGRSAANASLDLTLFAREQDVDALAFDLGVDALGNLVTLTRPDTGTQRRFGGRIGTTWGDAGPIGLSLSVSQTETRYSGTTDPDLVDSSRIGARAGLRLDLSPAMELTLTASTSRLDEDGVAATSVTDTFDIALSTDRPDGTLAFGLGLTQTDAGTRTLASVSRSFELPRGALSVSAGIEDSVGGDTGFNGALNWRHDRPTGSFSVGASFGIEQDSRDRETERARLSIDINEQLSQRLTGTLGLSYVDSSTSGVGAAVDTTATSLSAGLSYALTQDWGLSAQATHQIEDDGAAGKVDNTILSLSINRTFTFRP